MARLSGPAAIALGLILAACAGASPTIRPTSQPTTVSTIQPTAERTPTSPPTPSPTSPETVAPPSVTGAPPPPSGTPPPLGWLERADVAAGPSAREDHTWTIDDEGTTAYVFGGRVAGGQSDELWAFDLATDSWTVRQPSGDVPPARFGHTAVWVPGSGLVIWSGQAGASFFADVWAYDPSANTWTQLPSSGAEPAARYGSCASLGPDGELWISHGFTADSGRFADTRSYNFSTGSWTDRTPAGGVPVERCLHDCFWSQNGQLILYGGQTTGVAALGDIWAYDVATGAWAMGADPEAPARQLYALAADGAGGTVFGGGSRDRGFLADMWTIDPQTLALAPLEAGQGPTPRSGAALIRDPAGSRLVLFGGTNDDGALADLWEFGLP